MICIFKCPGCASNMRFNAQKQKMECPTCGVNVAVDEYDPKEIMLDGGQKCGDDTSSYRCPSCGAEVLTENLQVTCTCSWCGTEMAVFGEMENKILPEKVIPFFIEKDEAVNHFNKWWMDHETLPEFDRDKMKFDIHPLYLPVWLVDANVQTDMTAVVSCMELEDELSFYRKENGKIDRPFQYSRIDQPRSQEKKMKFYLVRKVISSIFRKVPSNASYHFSSTRFQGIEPYDYTQLQDFEPEYLSGFPAEQYSIEAQDVIPKTIKRVRDYGKDQCRIHILGSRPGLSDIDTEVESGGATELKEICYALVPVWICSYTYNHKKRMVYINGQTGKADGEVVVEEQRSSREFMMLFLANLWECLGLTLMAFVFMGGSGSRRRSSSLGFYVITLGLLHILSGDGSVFKKKNSNTDVLADISWKNGSVSKYMRGPKKVIPLKFILGTVFLLIGIGGYEALAKYLLRYKLSQLFPILVIISVVVAVVGTYIYFKKYIEDQTRQDKAEYSDYLQSDNTLVLESSVQPWTK